MASTAVLVFFLAIFIGVILLFGAILIFVLLKRRKK